ncbi:MAG: hypothetical protein K2X28_03620 [Alphaproteobacteria bacterium]|nr:hypothetical protein [Alphaproteobacteria bacterium]
MLIRRQGYIDQINKVYEVFPLCGLLGPRQCGKTTLAHQYAASLDLPGFILI